VKKLKAIGQTGKSARTLNGTTKNPLANETLAGDGLIPHKKCWGSHLHVMRYADFKKCKICCPRTTSVFPQPAVYSQIRRKLKEGPTLFSKPEAERVWKMGGRFNRRQMTIQIHRNRNSMKQSRCMIY